MIELLHAKQEKLQRDEEGRKYIEIYSGSATGLAMPTPHFNGLKPLGTNNHVFHYFKS